MPCGNYGATLSKAAYAEQKQDFLEQVRRKGAAQEHRPKRSRRQPSLQQQQDDHVSQQEQLQMQMQLGMAGIDVLQDPEAVDVDGLQHPALSGHAFPPDVAQDFYVQSHAYEPQHMGHNHEPSNNLFEINPRAAIQQLQQIQTANREHDLQVAAAAVLGSTSQTYDENNYTNEPDLDTSPENEPYVPSMMTIDNLMNQQQHAMRAEQQRAAEEAAVRARKEETLAQQRRAQQTGP